MNLNFKQADKKSVYFTFSCLLRTVRRMDVTIWMVVPLLLACRQGLALCILEWHVLRHSTRLSWLGDERLVLN